MFEGAELNMNLLSFQKLLAEGVFDNSSHTFSSEDCKILRKLILCDFTKSKWVEQYAKFKVRNIELLIFFSKNITLSLKYTLFFRI